MSNLTALLTEEATPSCARPWRSKAAGTGRMRPRRRHRGAPAAALASEALPSASLQLQSVQQELLRRAAAHAGAVSSGELLQSGAEGNNMQNIYSLAEALADSGNAPVINQVALRQDTGWLAPISNGLEAVLQGIQGGLDHAHVPYSYGWSIIAITLLTKVATFPFTKKQVESVISAQKLKPDIDNIKRRYEGDKERIQRETSALYEKAKVNPLAGCLPTLATIPVFWGLYRTLSNVTSEGLLTEGFYWIPTLSGPITLEQQRAGGGISSWLYPFVEGHPPIGWDAASRYLVLPVLLVVSQFVSTAIITPPAQPEDETPTYQKALTALVPFMVGWFALNLPAGLSLYYFCNIVLTSAIQIWLRKLGGASAFEWSQEIGLNQARRTGEVAVLEAAPLFLLGMDEAESSLNGEATGVEASASMAGADRLARRCKRKKLELLQKA